MKLDFFKMQGLGNDFVFIEDMEGELNLTDDQVRFICDRHFGIGADGVVLVRPSARSECAAYMHYINADGTLAEMCGNGVRCFAKYLVDREYVDPRAGCLVADTLAGPKPIEFEVDEQGKLTVATVDMGTPVLDPSDIPVDAPADGTYAQDAPCVRALTLASPWGDFTFTCVSMGNPHAVCFVDDWNMPPDDLFNDMGEKSLGNLEVDLLGAYFESHEAFPEKANIEFAKCVGSHIALRVFERGCGETLSCGTGACAVDVAAALTDRAGRENDVVLLGGTLHVNWRDDDHVMMTGGATEVFTGSIELP